MSATKLFDAGYKDLVSVIPPGAPLSENSTIDPKERGKCPGKKGSHGWYGYAFLTDAPDRDEVKKWDSWGANVGLLGRNFPGLDIDSEDRLLTQVVEKFAREKLGVAPVRLSRGDRRLLVYRTEEPFSRMALILTRAGKSHLVEFLGDGRQYLVHGRHPEGMEYRWQGKALWDVRPDDLPVVNQEKVQAFFTALAAALGPRGVEVERVGDGAIAKAAPPPEDLKAPSIAALRDLPLPPNPPEYGWDEFIKFGYAYWAAGADSPEEAFDLWCQWASEHPKFDWHECRRQWDKGFKDARVGWSWLQEQAQATGEYISAQDDFEADPSLAGQTLPPPPAATPAPEPETGKLRRLEFTDEWMVERLLPVLRPKICYVPGVGEGGRWYVWAGHKWAIDTKRDHEMVVRDELHKLALLQEKIADMAPSKNEGKEHLKAARRMQSEGGISAVLRLIRAPLAVEETDFDVDRMVLNTPAGVVDLRTGEITPATPEDRLARSVSVAPAGGEAPAFRKFLRDITGGDDEFQDWLQKLMGYCLTGDVSEKVLPYAWGGTDTGKSQWIGLFSALLGDYADSVDVEVFISKGGGKTGSKPDAELARLSGVRLVTASEPDAGASWDEQRVKSITGGDPISARFLYGQPFSYRPQFKILIVGNTEPEMRHVHDAILRRILILPFNHQVPRDRQVEHLAEKLVEREGPQILNWAIEGCLRWQAEGLAPPEAVAAKVRQYAEDHDTLQQFIDECCLVESGKQISRDDLFQSWSSWCRGRNESPGKALAFRGIFEPYARKLDLEEAFVTTTSGQRRRGYKGIALRPMVEQGTEEFAA